MSKETLHTKFGNARLDGKGYYRITSKKEGNSLKFLHRLIFEDYYHLTILPNNVIHHIDGNPQNNDISNLKLLSQEEHLRIHHSERLPNETKLKMSKSQNTTGYYRVVKERCPKCARGFYYQYRYYSNGKRKRIASVDLKKLEKKVKAKGLPWKKLTEE